MEGNELEAMRERLRQLGLIQRTMRAELKPMLAREVEADLEFGRALSRGKPIPPADTASETLAAMRRLSAVNKEIISLMEAIRNHPKMEDPG